MTWEIIAITFIVVISNAGQTYFSTWRMTSETFLKNIFQKDTPLRDIKVNSEQTQNQIGHANLDLSEIRKSIEDLKAEIKLASTLASGGYEQIYSLLMRGPQVKIAEMIEAEFQKKTKELKKREDDALNLAAKIEEYGKVILKHKG